MEQEFFFKKNSKHFFVVEKFPRLPRSFTVGGPGFTIGGLKLLGKNGKQSFRS